MNSQLQMEFKTFLNAPTSLQVTRRAIELVKGTPYWAVASPHLKSSISHLTMGDYQNYYHLEFRLSRILSGKDFLWYISSSICTNNSVYTGSTQRPYKSEEYSGALFSHLLMLRVKMIEYYRRHA